MSAGFLHVPQKLSLRAVNLILRLFYTRLILLKITGYILNILSVALCYTLYVKIFNVICWLIRISYVILSLYLNYRSQKYSKSDKDDKNSKICLQQYERTLFCFRYVTQRRQTYGGNIVMMIISKKENCFWKPIKERILKKLSATPKAIIVENI